MFDLTFLNSAFLFGLTGAILPLLIHLLNRRRIKIIDFSTLKYLSPLQKKQMRRLRIKEILLLIIRTLIIIFIALALARPALKGAFGSGVNAHTTTSAVLIIDDTYSMGYEGSEGTVFGKAKKKALELVELLNESDNANVIYLSDPENPLFEKPTHNFNLVGEKIEAHEVSAATGNILIALKKAADLLDESLNLNKEVYVITDLQAVCWDTLNRVVPDFTDKKRLFVIDVGYSKTNNIFIDDVDYSNQLLFADKPIRFSTRVFNGSDQEITDQLLQLYVNGVKKSQLGISALPKNYNTVSTSISFPDAKLYNGFVELPDDGLLVDNQKYFTVDIKGEINVLIVIDDAAAKENSLYLASGLNPLNLGESKIFPKEITAVELNSTRLDNYQVVVLSNVTSLLNNQMALLEQFVKDGGGLFVILGDRADVRFFNDDFLPRFIPASIKSLRSSDADAFYSWNKVDYDHYVFNVFDEKETPFQSLKFFYSYELLTQSPTLTLVNYNNQMPALINYMLEKGQVIVLPSALDNKWNNFPLRPAFLPFINRVVQFLGLGSNGTNVVQVNQPINKNIDNIPMGSEVTCIKPSGNVIKVSPETRDNRTILRFTGTDEPGIYTWRLGNEVIGYFAVNVNLAESNLERISQDKISSLFEDQNFMMLSKNDVLKELVLQVRYGRELWKFFLWIALLLMITELLLAWSIGRENKTEPAPAFA